MAEKWQNNVEMQSTMEENGKVIWQKKTNYYGRNRLTMKRNIMQIKMVDIG